MDLRVYFQWVTFGVDLVILISAVVGFIIRPDKRSSLFMWILYGAIAAGFYGVVLIGKNNAFGNEVSPMRALLKDAIVASSLFWLVLADLKRKYRQWKK